MEQIIDKAKTLIEVLPYIQMFRDAVVVVKFGGSAMEDPKLTAEIMRDVVMLEAIGLRPVVVHGGGKAISAELGRLNIETKFINGLRYTCDSTIKVVDDILHNKVNRYLVESGRDVGGKTDTLSGKDILKAERMFSTQPDSRDKIDIGFVGEVTGVDCHKITEMVEKNIIPVIPPLGIGAGGQVFNINADIAACKIAEALQARKLVFLSDVPGIMRDAKDENSVIPTIKTAEAEALINSGVISGGMIPKIKSCIHALQAGTNKVHMIDGRVHHALLLELFTDEGIGTEIVR
jgi:acetylglutamate kinase